MKSLLVLLMLFLSSAPLKAALLGYAYDLELLSETGEVVHTLDTALVVDTETREFLTVDVFLDEVESFSTNKPLEWNEWSYNDITRSWFNTCWAEADSNYVEGRKLLVEFIFFDVFVPEGLDAETSNPFENLDQLNELHVWVTFDDGTTFLTTAPAYKWDLGPVEEPNTEVPEPAPWMLLTLALTALLVHRQRARRS